MCNLEKAKRVTEAWYEINNHQYFDLHPIFKGKHPIYLIEPVLEMGNGKKSENNEENNVLRYWFEIIVPREIDESEYCFEDKIPAYHMFHMWQWDDGANTYEDAILKIHERIIKEYGKFRKITTDEYINLTMKRK